MSPDSGRAAAELANWLGEIEAYFLVAPERLLRLLDENDDYTDLDVDIPSFARAVGKRRLRLGPRVFRDPDLGPLSVDLEVEDEIRSE